MESTRFFSHACFHIFLQMSEKTSSFTCNHGRCPKRTSGDKKSLFETRVKRNYIGSNAYRRVKYLINNSCKKKKKNRRQGLSGQHTFESGKNI